MEEIKQPVETEVKVENETPSQTLEELQQALAEKEAMLKQRDNDYAKLKSCFDKTASEASKFKKDLQAKLTDEERIKAEQDELNQRNSEELNQLRSELQTIKAKKRYLEFGLDEATSSKCAEYDANNDIDSILKLIKTHETETLKKKEAEWLNRRPDVEVGGDMKANEDDFSKGFDLI